MELTSILPIVLYDDRCYLCIKFARVARTLCRERITIVGHYSPRGETIREKLLDHAALEMFWFIDKDVAYGGRAGLGRLIKELFFPRAEKRASEDAAVLCDAGCKTAKAVFVRSGSIISKSRKIRLYGKI